MNNDLDDVDKIVAKPGSLDRVIAEQAAYYGLTVEQYIHSSDTVARLQELTEEFGE